MLEGQSFDASGFDEEMQGILSELNEKCVQQNETLESYESLKERLEKLLDVLVEFAQFNFDMEIPLSDKADELDGIALGLQTLGQEIEYYQSQLEAVNNNLTEAQEMARLGSWEVKVANMEMRWSPQLYQIYGIAEKGNEMEEVMKLIHAKDNAILTRLFERCVQYHEPYTHLFKATVNGEIRFIDAQGKPIIEDGEVVKVVGTAMDVTERILNQRKLESLNTELEQKVAERTKDLEGFSYTVSHDLRAPLRSIIGFSNILEENHSDSLSDEALRLLKIIVKNATKMSTLIEELLTFSRVGITVAKFDRLDTNILLKNTWREALSNFEEKEKVQIHTEELPEIFGAQTMIQQVFLNLFSNALKYSSKNEVIEISVKLVKENEHFAEICVSDNGCGFDMKYHDKLFGVFQRLHSEDEFTGTGVGLALVKRIVDKHHGHIRAESEIGKGAQFFIKLPLVEPTLL